MNGRVNDHYGLPCSDALLNHMRSRFDDGSIYQRVFDELRRCKGSTAVHAANLNISERDFNHKAGIVGDTCVRELVKLADAYMPYIKKT